MNHVADLCFGAWLGTGRHLQMLLEPKCCHGRRQKVPCEPRIEATLERVYLLFSALSVSGNGNDGITQPLSRDGAASILVGERNLTNELELPRARIEEARDCQLAGSKQAVSRQPWQQ